MPFDSGQELESLIQKALARRILERAESYAISPVEWETLSALVEQPSRKEMAKQKPEEARHLYCCVQETGCLFRSQYIL